MCNQTGGWFVALRLAASQNYVLLMNLPHANCSLRPFSRRVPTWPTLSAALTHMLKPVNPLLESSACSLDLIFSKQVKIACSSIGCNAKQLWNHRSKFLFFFASSATTCCSFLVPTTETWTYFMIIKGTEYLKLNRRQTNSLRQIFFSSALRRLWKPRPSLHATCQKVRDLMKGKFRLVFLLSWKQGSFQPIGTVKARTFPDPGNPTSFIHSLNKSRIHSGGRFSCSPCCKQSSGWTRRSSSLSAFTWRLQLLLWHEATTPGKHSGTHDCPESLKKANWSNINSPTTEMN